MQSGSISYGERPQMGIDVEFGADPASGGFFNTDYRKHDDLKQMLDSNKDGLKLEAMKRIISMVARGRDASDLFPAVVKNVVSKNIEVKKLVYVYLMRYAEEQQDLVLLSISTFQRALKDPNQLIRASALRVLSSIRVLMIVPIVMLAIRDSASDMSPYVRKTAAHAIPKLHSLEPDQKDELITVIDKLLSDRTTLVVGSAVMAFEEVCPERVDLIHKNFRKLCNLLVDVDEWGQVIIINMLTRYARTQFVNPNPEEIDDEKLNKFYEDNEDSDQLNAESGKKKKYNNDFEHTPYVFDLDHRLLLRQTKPLLQSRNASVVMAVAQLYHHVAPRGEVNIIAKSLIRLLRGHKEVQSIVLTCIASMTTKRKSIFEIHLKSFFVRTNDPTNIKLLKLEILTNLATVNSIAVILREFQTYINSIDRPFVAATIQAIGRCAASIKEVTETCLSGLVQLLSNKDEHVVAESVVVIKKLLQTKAAEHFEIISQMAKLLDFITVPAARASILWLIGEYNDKVPKIAPDVLRKMAKTFIEEEEIVKLQCLNLSLKLYLTNPEQASLLCQYVFTLARYDSNYDVRDRARFLRQFILPSNGKSTVLSKKAQAIFLAPKPAPALESKYQGRDHFQLGSLSHYLNMRANGYTELPDFPDKPSDSSLRNIEPFKNDQHQNNSASQKNNRNKKQRNESFSESEKSSNYSNSEESSSSEKSSGEEEVDHETTQQKVTLPPKLRKAADGNSNTESSSDSSSSSDSPSGQSSSSDESSSESNSDIEEDVNRKEIVKAKKKTNEDKNSKTESKNNLDLLLDFNDILPAGPMLKPSIGEFLSPGQTPLSADIYIEPVGPSFVDFEHKDLVTKLSGNGLSIRYRFTRSPHLFSSSMVSMEFVFMNHSEKELKDIQLVSPKNIPPGISINEFAPIQILQPQQSSSSVFGVDWNDSTQSIEFEIQSSVGTFKISLKPPIGELIRSVQIGEEFFREQRQKLRGMNEHRSTVATANISDTKLIKELVFKHFNVASVPSSNLDTLNFAGQTVSSKSLVLMSLQILQNEISILVNCEKMVVGSMVLNQVCTMLSRF